MRLSIGATSPDRIEAFLDAVGQGRCDHVGLPVFLSGSLRHANLYIRTTATQELRQGTATIKIITEGDLCRWFELSAA